MSTTAPGNAEPQLGAKTPHAKLGLGVPNVPPGYNKTEVGVIPVEWESVKAGDIGRFRGGNGFPLRFQGETASGYPFYKVSDMNNEGNETFMFDSNNWISEGIRKQLGATAFPADTIIFAKVGAAVFLERKKILTKPSCIDNNLCGLVLDKSRTHVRFVHYSLLNIRESPASIRAA
jgi:type I restriction enzyme S subunit